MFSNTGVNGFLRVLLHLRKTLLFSVFMKKGVTLIQQEGDKLWWEILSLQGFGATRRQYFLCFGER
jgi:hypothetical protein